MPQKRTHKGAQIIAIIIAILLLCVAGFCAYLLIDNQQQKAEQKELFSSIAEKVDAAESELGDLGQHRTIAEASAVESPIRQETIGFPAHFFARAHNFKPPGRACQPEADSPMRT